MAWSVAALCRVGVEPWLELRALMVGNVGVTAVRLCIPLAIVHRNDLPADVPLLVAM